MILMRRGALYILFLEGSPSVKLSPVRADALDYLGLICKCILIYVM